MLSAVLMLWDIMWEQYEAPDGESSCIKVNASVVNRAFGLLELLESIAAIMAGKPSSDAFTTSSNVQAKRSTDEAELEQQIRSQVSRKHFNFEPQVQFSGIPDSELLQRLLLKAERVKADDSDVFHVKARTVYSCYNRSDVTKKRTKPTLNDFSKLTKSLSKTLGDYKEATDSFVIAKISDGNGEFDTELQKVALLSSEQLWSHVVSLHPVGETSSRRLKRPRSMVTAAGPTASQAQGREPTASPAGQDAEAIA